MVSKNFSEAELACKCCGVMGVQAEAIKALQALRDALGKPMHINSAYRCQKHNKAVGGEKHSKHVQGTAFDVSLSNLDRAELLERALKAGFLGIGQYDTFMHVDLGPRRAWDMRQ